MRRGRGGEGHGVRAEIVLYYPPPPQWEENWVAVSALAQAFS